jgi:hypothetical protein
VGRLGRGGPGGPSAVVVFAAMLSFCLGVACPSSDQVGETDPVDTTSGGGGAGGAGAAGGTTTSGPGGGGAASWTLAPDFSLLDVNETSATYETEVSPRDTLGQLSAWFFGSALCGSCNLQFAYLNQMQQEIDAESPAVSVSVLGVNYIGAEAGTPNFTSGVDLPWLQDLPEHDVWQSWGIVNKDLVVLDVNNEILFIQSLEDDYLMDQDNYDAFKQLLLDSAAAQ